MFHFLLFYTEGDSGTQDLKCTALRYKEILEKYIPSVHIYTPSRLLETSQYWSDVFADQRALISSQLLSEPFRWNPSWAALNFFLWKPALISHMMTTSSLIKEGDILLYHDIDFAKYPEYLNGISTWQKWITRKLDCADILVFDDNHSTLRCDVKREVIDRYLNTSYLDKPHLWAGAIAFRKSAASLSFIEKWLSLTSDIKNRSQATTSFYPGFIWHAADQATLAVTYYLLRSSLPIKSCFLFNSRLIPPSFSHKMRYYVSTFSLRSTCRWFLVTLYSLFTKFTRLGS